MSLVCLRVGHVLATTLLISLGNVLTFNSTAGPFEAVHINYSAKLCGILGDVHN